ncbi:MAG: alanine racemase, partial [Angelakisella sp.]
MESDCFNSYLEVDLGKMVNNIHTIQRENPQAQVIPVLKCNGYGMGAVPMAKALGANGVSLFAVAQVQEALELRHSGITADILVLGGVPAHNLPAAVHYNIQLTAFSTESLAALAQEVKKANKRDYPIQIKIETGLNRIGARVGA